MDGLPSRNLSPKDLAILTDSMGFSLQRVRNALLNSTSLEGAINWMLDHEHDQDIGNVLPVVSSTEPTQQSANACQDIQDKCLDESKQNKFSWNNGKLSDQHNEETGADFELLKAKMLRKERQGEIKKERKRLLAEFRRDHVKLLDSHRERSPLTKAEKLYRDDDDDANFNQDMKKRASLQEANVLLRRKQEAARKERGRITEQIEQDHQKLEVRCEKAPHYRDHDVDPRGNIRKTSTHSKENSEKETILEQAKVARKKKEVAFRKERARLMAEIEKDRLDFKLRHGQSSLRRQSPKDTPAKGQHFVSKPTPLVEEDDDCLIDDCIRVLSSYKLGGRGEQCLNILRTYVANIVNNPKEKKYTRINTNNEVFKAKVKPFVGAKKLLRAVGFVHDEEDRAALVLGDRANFELMEKTKMKLESACTSYE